MAGKKQQFLSFFEIVVKECGEKLQTSNRSHDFSFFLNREIEVIFRMFSGSLYHSRFIKSTSVFDLGSLSSNMYVSLPVPS